MSGISTKRCVNGIMTHEIDTLCPYYQKQFIKVLFCNFKGVALTICVNCIFNNSQTEFKKPSKFL